MWMQQWKLKRGAGILHKKRHLWWTKSELRLCNNSPDLVCKKRSQMDPSNLLHDPLAMSLYSWTFYQRHTPEVNNKQNFCLASNRVLKWRCHKDDFVNCLEQPIWKNSHKNWPFSALNSWDMGFWSSHFSLLNSYLVLDPRVKIQW